MIEAILRTSPRRYADIVNVLVSRYVKVRYRGSVLGVFWSVLNPLIMTVLYGFIFGRAFLPYYGNSRLGYVTAVFIGIVTLNYFSTSTAQALESVVSNDALLNKLRVVPSVFPVATVLANSVQFAIGVLPLLLALAFLRNPLFALTILIPAGALLLICIGVALLVSAAYVFFRDIPYLWNLCIFALFVATPVFYPIEIVDPRFQPLIRYNPLTMIVEQIRRVIVFQQPPSIRVLLLLVVLSIAILAIGWLTFGRTSRRFADYL
jgi:lipopolysaccharide transport system permease protein